MSKAENYGKITENYRKIPLKTSKNFSDFPALISHQIKKSSR